MSFGRTQFLPLYWFTGHFLEGDALYPALRSRLSYELFKVPHPTYPAPFHVLPTAFAHSSLLRSPLSVSSFLLINPTQAVPLPELSSLLPPGPASEASPATPAPDGWWGRKNLAPRP